MHNQAPATILIADDDEDIRLALSLLLSSHGYAVREAGSPKDVALAVSRNKPDLVLLDMNFSRDTTSGAEGLEQLQQLNQQAIPVILMTAWGSIDLAVKGIKLGALDFIQKPWDKNGLLEVIQTQLQQPTKSRASKAIQQSNDGVTWISHSAKMQALDKVVEQIAATDANVLILGENGTGKSQLANRIHQLSARAQGPFIAVNMAAVPENLFESELFGHQKGAFTDAKQNRTGRFEMANSGTLFLDEIGTLPLSLQPKLLRVLETGQYEELGSSQTKTANIRLLSATNADLQQMVADKQFRQDLLFRLNTLVLTVPPLRERLADISPLAEHFIQQFCQRYQKPILKLSSSALETLQQYPWPGNIRELSHVIERAVLLCPGSDIHTEQLTLNDLEPTKADIPLQPLEDVEQQMIVNAMQATDGQVAKAAELLGISRNALYRRLEKFSIGSSE